uniref:Uncharacterized protein n=2 Tax=Rhizophora mucronata TaxID=61149 RepID=A0A2P2MFH7_RHIMU
MTRYVSSRDNLRILMNLLRVRLLSFLLFSGLFAVVAYCFGLTFDIGSYSVGVK